MHGPNPDCAQSQVSIKGKENLFSYKVTPAIIRYFCKTCANRLYGAKLDEDGNEQVLVRGSLTVTVLSCL